MITRGRTRPPRGRTLETGNWGNGGKWAVFIFAGKGGVVYFIGVFWAVWVFSLFCGIADLE